MIRNDTARRLMYDWHGGQSSAMYAAASSGLVESFVALSQECTGMGSDGTKLLAWLTHWQLKAPHIKAWDGRMYYALPWARMTR